MAAPSVSPKVGETFGRLTVTGDPLRFNNNIKLPVKCSCGAEKVVYQTALLKGRTKSCGCLNKELLKERAKYPMLQGDRRLYSIWFAMVGRCTKPNHKCWENYGGRGITVSKSWLTFENFYKDMFPRPPGKMSLERRNNDDGYSKKNCVWASRQDNQLNKRNTVIVEYLGQKMNLIQLSKLTGISWNNIYHRMYHGATVEEAVRPVPFKSKNGQAVWNNKPTKKATK